MRVLGIDDSEDITEMLEDVLIPSGFEFKFVNNGKDGLKLIQEQKWGAVLLDIAMPHFSGKDVVNELIKNGDIKKQPIILFTASSISNEEIECMLKQGVKCCLKKPVVLDTLLKLLKILEKNPN